MLIEVQSDKSESCTHEAEVALTSQGRFTSRCLFAPPSLTMAVKLETTDETERRKPRFIGRPAGKILGWPETLD